MTLMGQRFAYRERTHTPGDPEPPVEVVKEDPRRSHKVREHVKGAGWGRGAMTRYFTHYWANDTAEKAQTLGEDRLEYMGPATGLCGVGSPWGTWFTR
jgi:hypothetical protein